MKSKGNIKITTKDSEATPPKDADFAIYINFSKNTKHPQRIFQTASALISSFEKIDRTLCGGIDSNITPIMMLEEIQTGSLKIWLKNVLESVDDQAIKSLDWKQAVGKYLVKAKYAIIKWANEDHGADKKTLLELSQEIQKIAMETDIKHLPDYRMPPVSDLIQSIESITEAKSYLDETDSLTYFDKEGEVIFDLTINWTPEKISELITKEIVQYPEATMILAVKKPDYLGDSKWELRHGKKIILAKIEDRKWLAEFQSRAIDVRPGDALRCKVIQEFYYGFDNELISEKYNITKVEEVLENQYKQLALFDKNSDNKK